MKERNILITGGTGYLGSWVVKGLLEKAYTVRLTVRNKNKKEGYRHLSEIAESTPGNLEIYEADLLIPGSFDKAAMGADAIIHMASPFYLDVKDAQKELIDPALKGTRNVLEAANNSDTVKKVVLTSSVAAIYGDNIDMKEQGLKEFSEVHFNTSSSLTHQPYSFSKVVAEKEAWKIHKSQEQWELIVMNPAFVMGPALSLNSSSESLKFMEDMLSGKFKMGAPDLQFGYVDVRDVANAHILALENDKAKGRHILSERTAGIYDLAGIIEDKFPGKYKLPRMVSPKPLLYLIGWMFGLKWKFIQRNVGHPIKLNNTKSKRELGLVYTPLEKTIEDMVLQKQMKEKE